MRLFWELSAHTLCYADDVRLGVDGAFILKIRNSPGKRGPGTVVCDFEKKSVGEGRVRIQGLSCCPGTRFLREFSFQNLKILPEFTEHFVLPPQPVCKYLKILQEFSDISS
jgi:hypothetical protein